MSRTKDIESRIRASAKAELEKRVEEAVGQFRKALSNARQGAPAPMSNSHELNRSRISVKAVDGEITVKSNSQELLLMMMECWLADSTKHVEDKAVADFIGKVERLASEVEEIRNYAQHQEGQP